MNKSIVKSYRINLLSKSNVSPPVQAINSMYIAENKFAKDLRDIFAFYCRIMYHKFLYKSIYAKYIYPHFIKIVIFDVSMNNTSSYRFLSLNPHSYLGFLMVFSWNYEAVFHLKSKTTVYYHFLNRLEWCEGEATCTSILDCLSSLYHKNI
jgi:hypothetical protein